ncbi:MULTISPECIES: capsular biosynthesis protein [unclassified Shewanella]|uniref:capsular biosynthesis protein n=1 Tax=unclassified Shewanella TaxID=196818 RepID=UPI000C81A2EC|nr:MULTISPECIES: capsular biosynthesis protein [unclassified Shewanella]MDO6619571.1 O-antigen ligase domain-containing protein [Shewanella sp. 6_MG-2023]MDO6641199.1 O-antigen ligase domain-containing protein [Shewanella sp. 5_MG-2023]MDO6679487.1 O-antigen ligase domain-containing protein [Shewanella sp. 4_MG-2023]MDO6775866.1 O-antigen ligase domain-containing protein [Shewanella sp. 3_MG-2023]PMG42860.1 capsular biosynthesis protein [Shewanella sp. 10N.286.52.B9]
MDPQTIVAQNVDEKIIYNSIVYSYLFWLFGALYVIAPVIAWVLFARLLYKKISGQQTYRISISHYVWVFGMLFMLIALVVGHLDFGLGIGKLIKSSIGWAKGWALLAIFPLIGCLSIRPEIIYRACCRVCKHTILLFPLFLIAWKVGLPSTLYVSPLSIIGGPGPEFFSVSLYEIDPGSGVPRWRLFTPWAPALGMLGNLYFIFAVQEKDSRWKKWGIAGSLLMVLMSQSRLGLVCYFALIGFFTLFKLVRSPLLYFLLSPLMLLIGVVGEATINKIQISIAAIKAARADSTRVRQALADIAVERWMNEAVIFGHGIVERGPHMVEYMPIGSHHTWYGLLFVKGVVGAVALAIPMLVTFLILLIRLFSQPMARVGMAILLMLSLYTFGENLEILAYLFWPGLIVLGMTLRAEEPEAVLKKAAALKD